MAVALLSICLLRQALFRGPAGAASLQACGTCSIACHDAATLTEEVLLEPFRMGAALQLGGSRAPAATAAADEGPALQHALLWLDEEALQLPVPAPEQAGMHLHIRCLASLVSLRSLLACFPMPGHRFM